MISQPPHRSRSIVALLALLLLPLLSPLRAQQTADPVPTLTVSTRLVVLDIVFTGPDGKPIDNLKQSEVQVFEDKAPQQIRSFEPPQKHALPPASDVPGAVFDPAKPASFGQSPVNILVLDQLNTHFADTSFARRQLHDYLAAQPAQLAQPTTLLALADNHFRMLQGFTRDRDALLKALAGAPIGYDWKLELNGKSDYGPVERLDDSLTALEQIAQSFARIPGRKNLVWVGGGFPTIDPTTIDGVDAQAVKDTLRHVTDVLLDTRVTLYAVDPTSSAAGLTEITDQTELEFAQDAAGGMLSNADPFDGSEDFDRLGPVTGGRVVRGMNDVAHQIASDIDLASTFYTLSYRPTNTSDASEKFRRIRVVCLRAGCTATTRSGYYAGEAQQRNTAATAAYDLTAAAESGLPLNALHVTVDPSPSSPGSYLIHVAAPDLNWKPNSDGSSTASVYVLAVALDAKDKQLAHTLRGMLANAKPGVRLNDPNQLATFVFPPPLEKPKAKPVRLRFIVRDSSTGRMGSVDLATGK